MLAEDLFITSSHCLSILIFTAYPLIPIRIISLVRWNPYWGCISKKRNNRNKCTQHKQCALTWHGTISGVITKTIMDGDRKHSVINFPLPLAEWKINYYPIHNFTGQYVTHSICVKNIFTCRRRSTYTMPKHARARARTHTHTHTHSHTHTHARFSIHKLNPWTWIVLRIVDTSLLF